MRFTTSSMIVIAAMVGGCMDAEPIAETATDEAAISCGAGGVGNPFGNHAQPYAGGLLPSHRTQSQRDATTKSYYTAWKAKYVKQGCGTGRYYVKTFMSDSQTVSEAHATAC
jgi:hypothetical protein